eukprot:2104901-Amphidinium_carterae.1
MSCAHAAVCRTASSHAGQRSNWARPHVEQLRNKEKSVLPTIHLNSSRDKENAKETPYPPSLTFNTEHRSWMNSNTPSGKVAVGAATGAGGAAGIATGAAGAGIATGAAGAPPTSVSCEGWP